MSPTPTATTADPMTASQGTTDLRPLLKRYFGYEEFRPEQEAIIANALAGRHGLVIMPTGGGKSLCYQLPAMAIEGLTLVVSPLIALMKDQVDALRGNGVSAAFINSTMDFERHRAGATGGPRRQAQGPIRRAGTSDHARVPAVPGFGACRPHRH